MTERRRILHGLLGSTWMPNLLNGGLAELAQLRGQHGLRILHLWIFICGDMLKARYLRQNVRQKYKCEVELYKHSMKLN